MQHGDAIMSGHSQSIEVGQIRKMLMHVVEPYFGRDSNVCVVGCKIFAISDVFERTGRCLPRQMQGNIIGNGTSVAGGFCLWKGV